MCWLRAGAHGVNESGSEGINESHKKATVGSERVSITRIPNREKCFRLIQHLIFVPKLRLSRQAIVENPGNSSIVECELSR